MAGRPLIKVSDWDHYDAARELALFWEDMKSAVADAVAASFERAGMANPTRDEVKRRTLVAKELVDVMRRDLKWSRQRIRDTLRRALDAKLVGLHFDLEALSRRGSW